MKKNKGREGETGKGYTKSTMEGVSTASGGREREGESERR